MTREYSVMTEGQYHTVIISDEREALLAAKAAGKASVGLWKKDVEQDLSMTGYVAESLEDLDDEYLEQVVRRNLGLPWKIAETKRLLIREFQPGDELQIAGETGESEADKVFHSPGLLRDYIRYQYGFYGYGIWAIEEKISRKIAGKAGIVNLTWDIPVSDGLELGYHIFAPYRRQGYGMEACRAILLWYKERMDCPLYAKIDACNEASVRLIKKLGFSVRDRRCNESGQWRYLYEWNC